MDAEALVLSLLDASPLKEIRGRKRLQKLAFFAVRMGAPTQIKFFLHDFGPFSAEIAAASEMLALLGEIDETDQSLGRSKKFVKVYNLNRDGHVNERLPIDLIRKIDKLQNYTTVELEIASTILFYRDDGRSWQQAIEATKELKPAKSIPQVIAKAKQALAEVNLYEGRGAD